MTDRRRLVPPLIPYIRQNRYFCLPGTDDSLRLPRLPDNSPAIRTIGFSGVAASTGTAHHGRPCQAVRAGGAVMLDLGTRLDLAGPAYGDTAMPLQGIDVTLWSAGAPPVGGTILEMSPRDLKLQLRGDVKAGSIVELEVFSRLHDFSFSVRGQLHWRQPLGANTIAGIFLHHALSHEVVSPFWSDLRKELRYACDWSCLILIKRRRRSVAVHLLNYSRSGVLIACRERIASGEEVSILDPSQTNPATIVSGIVRWHSQNSPTEQLIGCELPEDHGLRVSAYLHTAGCW